jgi:NAD(P)-dependent dehydrogenase (short-subunit alcohol dehydrogenase family)
VLDLTGKTAIVTGAGSIGPGWGNGKAMAVLFARQGAKVFGIDINPAAAVTGDIIQREGHSSPIAAICLRRKKCGTIAAAKMQPKIKSARQRRKQRLHGVASPLRTISNPI